MKNSIRAVVFDLDGTLTDTLDDIATAMNRALKLHGLEPWPVPDYRYLVGNGARVLASRAVRDRQDLMPAVLRDYQAYYGAHALVKTAPYPGIPELLDALAARGLKLFVLSNKPDADTRNVISHFFPGIPFALVRGQLEGVPVKPDPAPALALAEEAGLPPAAFAYLGDTSVDMTCAVAAGMRPVGVLWGFRTAEELTKSGAEILLSVPADLLTWLDHCV